jgi:hypothetical protein
VFVAALASVQLVPFVHVVALGAVPEPPFKLYDACDVHAAGVHEVGLQLVAVVGVHAFPHVLVTELVLHELIDVEQPVADVAALE